MRVLQFRGVHLFASDHSLIHGQVKMSVVDVVVGSGCAARVIPQLRGSFDTEYLVAFEHRREILPMNLTRSYSLRCHCEFLLIFLFFLLEALYDSLL